MKKVIYSVLALAPALGFAQNLSTLDNILAFIQRTVRTLIPIFFGLAIVYFFWGLIKYIKAAGDPKLATEGKSIMIWGVIAIAVMASIWGLVLWLQGVFGITNVGSVTPPGVIGL